MAIYQAPHSGRMPTAFYWVAGLTLLITGMCLLSIILGGSWPGKTIALLILLLTFLGIALMFWHYARSFSGLHYELNPQGVLIHWGRKLILIPYDTIIGVEERQVKNASRIFGYDLSKYRQGVFTYFPLGKVNLFSIGENLVFLQTEEELYGISPDKPEAFLAALHQIMDSRRLIWQQQVRKSRSKATHSFFRDGWSVAGLLLGIGLLLGMAVHVNLVIPQLPEQIPVHYNWAGEVDRYGSPQELYIWPVISLVSWLPLTIIGIVFASYDHRIGRYTMAITNGVVLMFWAIFLSGILFLLP